MQVTTNLPADRFQQLSRPIVGPVQPRRFGLSRRAVRRIRRDFGLRPQPGAGVPSGSAFLPAPGQPNRVLDRFTGVRKFVTVAGTRKFVQVNESRHMGAMGIGRNEQFLLQTLVGGLATATGSFLGTRAGITSAIGTQTQAGGTSPALQSLLADAAKAGGLEATARALMPKPTVVKKKPISTTTLLVGGGVLAAALTAIAFLR